MVPYTVFNYMLGLTDIRMRDFIPGGIGMLPGICVRLFVGTTLSCMTEDSMSIQSIIFGEHSTLIITMIVIGMLVGISGITYITILTKQYIKQLEKGENKGLLDERTAQDCMPLIVT